QGTRYRHQAAGGIGGDGRTRHPGQGAPAIAQPARRARGAGCHPGRGGKRAATCGSCVVVAGGGVVVDMRLWRWILVLVILAALAAFGWHWVADDPGYVLVRL